MSEIRPSAFTNTNFPVGTIWNFAPGYELHFTLDGNLELTGPLNRKLWESDTRGRGAGILSMQKDGDLVIYDASRRRAIWSTCTKGHPGAYLALQNDGNVVLYSGAGHPLWSTGTSRAVNRA